MKEQLSSVSSHRTDKTIKDFLRGSAATTATFSCAHAAKIFIYKFCGCGSSGMRVWRLKIDTHRHLKAGEAIYIKKSMR
jgi:hypothetical protein